jgi:succinoglycan biosynthesis transport protein ExoP
MSTPSRQMISRGPSAPLIERVGLPEPDGWMAGASQQFDSPLAAYWHVLVKRRWTIFAVAFLLTAIVGTVSHYTTPVYKATARLEIEPETPVLQSDYQKADADDVFLQTQIQVVRSENLAWTTITQLGLAPSLGVIPREKVTTQELEKHKVQLIGVFGKHLMVELVPRTRMLAVSFEHANPELAAQVATTLVKNYLEYNYRQKYDAIGRSGWMEQQLNELKTKVEKSQQAVITYEQQHQIANTGEKQNVLEQMLADLSRDLTNAQSIQMEKKSLYQQLLANRSEMASLAHDDLLQKLEEKLAELKQQYTETVAQYGPNFPRSTRLQAQINENQAQIEREQNRVLDRIRTDYTAATNREKLSSDAVAHQKEEVGNLNQLLVQHSMLQREFESNQQLYQSLLQRLKDATISAALRSTNIHLVDSALPPGAPVRPRKFFNTAIAFFAGMILGVMGAFAQDWLDSSIKTTEEAEALMVTPALGIIPFERGSWFPTRLLSRQRRAHQLAVAVTKQPNSLLSEAFRALGTAVSSPSTVPKILLVTSAQSGEGKTVTALNLALALAQRKGPVVIVDCDLRKGSISQVLGIKNHKGVSTVLTGEQDFPQVLHQYAPDPNLWILPSGPVPVNPVKLLASERLPILLKVLAARFECVVIDSPPVLAVTDATILANLADGVLLVTASGITSRAGLMRTRRILATAGARILGITVTHLDRHAQGYGSYGYS